MAFNKILSKFNRLQSTNLLKYLFKSPNNGRIPTITQQACAYATSKKDKCKKVGKKEEAKCPSFKLKNCAEAFKSVPMCKKQPEVKPCKKQEAPYPAYSDLCHTEVEEKPSECKLCPYKEDPNFLPPKRRFHTSTIHRLAFSPILFKDTKDVKPCPTGPSDYDRSDYDNPKPCNPKPDNTKICPKDLLETNRRKKPLRGEPKD